MNVVILGLWHLGGVTAACVAEHFPVVGLDFDEPRLTNLRDGRAPLFEPGLDDLLRADLAAGQLRFEHAETPAGRETLAVADVLWVCDDTPVDEQDVADVPYVLDRLARCLPALRPGAVVLISSQVPAGTCRGLEARYPGRAFAYCPRTCGWARPWTSSAGPSASSSASATRPPAPGSRRCSRRSARTCSGWAQSLPKWSSTGSMRSWRCA